MALDSAALAEPRVRLASLDAFRGFVIVLMFFVNLSANRDAFPEWFGHAGWNGGRHGQWLADFVFPWFLLAVGVAIPFSMHSGRGRGQPMWRRVLGIVRRGVVLYLLGILIFAARSSMDLGVWQPAPGGSGGSLVLKAGRAIDWATFLHWDILPLIGLAYALGSLLAMAPMWARMAFIGAVLIGKWAIMPDLTTTAGLDPGEWAVGRNDLERSIRGTGWFGTLITQGLPATCAVVLGTFVGDVWRATETPPKSKVRWLMLAGAASTVAALLWSRWLPISKDFFTSTYVLLSAGTGVIVLGLASGALDAWRWTRLHLAAVLGAALAIVATAAWAWPGAFSASQAGALTCAAVAGLVRCCVVIAGSKRSEPARCGWLVAYGRNAILVYVVGELLWTLVWMRWRVQCPGDIGGQVAFAALQVHARTLLEPIAGAALAKGLGPWVATGVLVGAYGAVCVWLDRRTVYFKV